MCNITYYMLELLSTVVAYSAVELCIVFSCIWCKYQVYGEMYTV